MAIIKKNYKDLNDTLRHLRLQIEESKNFCTSWLPKFNDPLKLFFYLKPYVKYKLDPPRTELIQSVPTLIKNNYWGVSGSGDCDCFSVLMATACMVQRWPGAKVFIKLCGRNRFNAVHIYTGVDFNGKEYNLDLTNKLPMIERDYPYKQKIYLKKLLTK